MKVKWLFYIPMGWSLFGLFPFLIQACPEDDGTKKYLFWQQIEKCPKQMIQQGDTIELNVKVTSIRKEGYIVGNCNNLPLYWDMERPLLEKRVFVRFFERKIIFNAKDVNPTVCHYKEKMTADVLGAVKIVYKNGEPPNSTFEFIRQIDHCKFKIISKEGGSSEPIPLDDMGEPKTHEPVSQSDAGIQSTEEKQIHDIPYIDRKSEELSSSENPSTDSSVIDGIRRDISKSRDGFELQLENSGTE